MSTISSNDQAFINRLTGIILTNLGNEQFGLDELVRAAGMSRAVIYHRLLEITGKSTTQFIRELRLKQAMELLQQESITASEVSYKVGFGSPAYFNTCFHEYFGYPPGEVLKNGRQELADNDHLIPDVPVETEVIPVLKDTTESVSKVPVRKVVKYGSITLMSLFGLACLWILFGNKNLKSSLFTQVKRTDKSIAVLPFKSLSSDVENQYFAEGITTNILYNLIQISEIKVINSPVGELGGNAINLNDLASKLNVRFFLSGSVQKSGEQILVMTDLTDVTINQIIWSEKYTRQLSDIFLIQSEIANQVATNLQSVITKNEKEQIEKIPTKSKEAHAYYLMGRYLLDRRSWREEEIRKYIIPFKNAIAADPEYAEAYVGLADVYSTLARTNSYPRQEGFIKAKENVLKALDLNSNLADAHTTLGVILYRSEWKWEEATKELELAIKLNPNYAQAHRYYAELMEILRHRELARLHGFKAAELDPISPYLILWKAHFLEVDKNFKEALKEYNKFTEMYPENPSGYWYLGDFYLIKGDGLKTVECYQKAYEFYPDDKLYVDTLKEVYDKHGIRGLEKWLIEYCIKNDDKGSWKEIVLYFNKIGEKEKALEWLEKAFEWQEPYLPDMNSWSELDNLRSEPRFQALLGKMGLSAYQK